VLRGWPFAFALTEIVEMPIWIWALSRFAGSMSVPRRVELAFLASMLTHPWVWFVFPQLHPALEALGLSRAASWNAVLFAAEIFAWLVEAWLLSRFGLTRALTWSAIANAASYGVGRIVWAVLF
jgi:hypothetical protein